MIKTNRFVLSLAAIGMMLATAACASGNGGSDGQSSGTGDGSTSFTDTVIGGDLGLPYEVLEEGVDHISIGTRAIYQHYPPSSGQHYGGPAAPIRNGIYRDPVDPEVWVHNLEHGYVLVLYNCSADCDAIEASMRDLNRTVPNSKYGYPKLIASPNDQIQTAVVALAWGWQLDLDEPDLEALVDFYRRFADNGPEDAP